MFQPPCLSPDPATEPARTTAATSTFVPLACGDSPPCRLLARIGGSLASTLGPGSGRPQTAGNLEILPEEVPKLSGLVRPPADWGTTQPSIRDTGDGLLCGGSGGHPGAAGLRSAPCPRSPSAPLDPSLVSMSRPQRAEILARYWHEGPVTHGCSVVANGLMAAADLPLRCGRLGAAAGSRASQFERENARLRTQRPRRAHGIEIPETAMNTESSAGVTSPPGRLHPRISRGAADQSRRPHPRRALC